MLILLEILMQESAQLDHLHPSEQPGRLALDEAKCGDPIQLQVRVYRSGECDVSDTMACLCATRGAGICAMHAIGKGRQQVCHCINQEFSTPLTE
jgi:hypothetical protein